ncbi:MAG: NitT/TauT family transport system substrate-binding protein [Actinomycetota bacterium]|nr:NitT/TauT family transport system substrate-binding protein [Actinomycetota bacterium]
MRRHLSPARPAAGRLAAAAVALGLVVLVACGGSDSSSTTSPSGASKVSLAYSAWPGWFPWQVAQEKGIFAAHDLDVNLRFFESYTDSLNALATGNVDANSQTLNDTLSSVVAGSKQTIVLVNDNSTGNDQVIVGPGIERVEDLRGKKVAVEEGTVDHYLLLLGLEKAGMKQSDVSLQRLLTDAAAAAFASGQVDAVGAFAPFTTEARKREGSTVLFTSKDFPGAIPDHLVFSTDFVQSHPDVVQKLVDAWFDTIAFIKANPDESVAIMAKKGGVSPEDYKSYNEGTTIFTVADNVEAFAPGTDSKHLDYQASKISDFLVGTGLIDKAPDLAGLFEPRFVQARAAAGG